MAGRLGDRLKVRVTARRRRIEKPTKAVCRLLAKHLHLKPAQVRVVGGKTSPEKRIEIIDADPNAVAALFEF
ncbi:MAG: DUF167 domain-containing protein [Phycisphaerales bacterium]|nr:DUF167 domain-containing protein [Phycisphaerales bacterium]